jgi:response regulator RpfG family c-di-GMP phosphodiesterase
MGGYKVTEAGNLDEAVRGLEQHSMDAVLVAENLPPRGASAVVEAMRRRPEWEPIPVMDLAAWEKRRCAQEAHGDGPRFQKDSNGREGILNFLAGLSEQEPACAGRTEKE